MAAFTSAELAEHAGLNTDGMAGFEAQIASKTTKCEALWPEHLKGPRVDDFRYGSLVARTWMSMRRNVGAFRRMYRLKEKKEVGIMTVLKAGDAAELKREQLETLRNAVEINKLAKMRIDGAAAVDGEPAKSTQG